MNSFIVNGAIRWAVNTVIGFLLARGLISAGDQAAWTNTFTEFFAALASISMLLWVVISNRWPNLVHGISNLPQVDKVALNRGVVMTETLKDNPSVVVSANSQRVGG